MHLLKDLPFLPQSHKLTVNSAFIIALIFLLSFMFTVLLAADLEPKETILHLAVRFGLVHLSQFVIHQPKGQRALTLPNQDGYTPLQLAQKEGRHAMFRILTA